MCSISLATEEIVQNDGDFCISKIITMNCAPNLFAGRTLMSDWFKIWLTFQK